MPAAENGRTPVALEGVPETLLWTLYHRASEARRPDAVLDDPQAVALVDRIDYPFADRFGDARAAGQWQALRARTFDVQVRRFLAANPGGTVVALGEGLETQFWRVDDGRVRWLTVDLPETVAVRERLLPAGERRRVVEGSALDERWMDAVDAQHGVLLTAQGLFMYFEREQVHGLITGCARRFPGAALVFDALPSWLAVASRRQGGVRGGTGYQAPPWHWGIDPREERRLRALPGVVRLRRLLPPRGRGPLHGLALPALGRVPVLPSLGFGVLRADFA
jgi:O-methyltransferase involved in polyketide biosynthesis